MARLTLKRVVIRDADYYLFRGGNHVESCFCRKDFELITGIKLKPGEVREIESIKIKLKPARKKK